MADKMETTIVSWGWFLLFIPERTSEPSGNRWKDLYCWLYSLHPEGKLSTTNPTPSTLELRAPTRQNLNLTRQKLVKTSGRRLRLFSKADEIDSLKLGEINDLALEMLPILTHEGSKGRLTTLTLRINAFPNCLDGLQASLRLGSGASSGGGEL